MLIVTFLIKLQGSACGKKPVKTDKSVACFVCFHGDVTAPPASRLLQHRTCISKAAVSVHGLSMTPAVILATEPPLAHF